MLRRWGYWRTATRSSRSWAWDRAAAAPFSSAESSKEWRHRRRRNPDQDAIMANGADALSIENSKYESGEDGGSCGSTIRIVCPELAIEDGGLIEAQRGNGAQKGNESG